MTEKLSEFVDYILLDWLPESLKEGLDAALAAGISRDKLLTTTANVAGRDSFTYLATWAYLERNGGGPLPESWRPDLEPKIFLPMK